jgi:hypothetical protein
MNNLLAKLQVVYMTKTSLREAKNVDGIIYKNFYPRNLYKCVNIILIKNTH